MGSSADTDRRCRELASQQYGLLTRSQLKTLGVSNAALYRRVSRGAWERPMEGVFGVGPPIDSWRRRLLCACLGTQGVASHRAAASLHGLDGFRARDPEVMTTKAPRRAPEGVIVHRTKSLPDADVMERYGIPVTIPTRTLLDLGAVVGASGVRRALEDSFTKHLVTLPRLYQQLRATGRSGRPGTATLRQLLRERGPDDVRTESELERALARLLAAHNYPQPHHQYVVEEAGLYVARVDAAYPDRLLAIEADGYEFHSARPDWLLDRRRQNALVSRGWRVLRFTPEDDSHPRAFLGELARLWAS